MKVDAKLVSEMATVMKLSFSENESEQLVKELNNALEMLGSLSEVDTEGVESTYYGGLGEAVLREDQAIESPEQVQAMLKQVRASEDRMIEVPAMIDDGGAA